MKKTLLIILAFVSIKTYSQQNTFTEVLYDSLLQGIEAHSMVRTPDKGYMIAGKSAYSNGYLLRLDSSGNFLWNKSYFNSVLMEFNCIAATYDSGFVIAGDAYNSGGFSDAFYGKVNAMGDTLWMKTISYAGYNLTVLSLQQTNDSGYIMTGSASNNGSPYSRILVAKINNAGNLEWSNLLTGALAANKGNMIKQDADSNFILTGYLEDGPPLYQTGALLAKLSQTGAVLWAKNYYISTGITQGNDFEFVNNGIVLNFTTGGLDALLKTDFSGNILWCNTYAWNGGGAPNFLNPRIHLTADSGFILLSGGSFGGGATRIDSAGNSVWSNMLSLVTADIMETDNKEFFILGNGPQFGVKGSTVYSPQIGIIQIDSMSTAQDCVYPNINSTTALSVNSANISLTSLSGATTATIQSVINTVAIKVDPGCVAFVGGINENEANHITILPNPSSGVFTIVTTERKTDALIIYDMLGKEVYSTNITGSKTDIDLSSHPKGIYYCRITSKNKNVSAGQIVVIE